jgi:hypothetical protein
VVARHRHIVTTFSISSSAPLGDNSGAPNEIAAILTLAEPAQVGLTAILGEPPPSTSGLGRHPFKVVARVRIPLGASSSTERDPAASRQ